MARRNAAASTAAPEPGAPGSSLDLSTFENASGATFPGIDGTGVWLVALFCTSECNNPAPWSITVPRPCQ